MRRHLRNAIDARPPVFPGNATLAAHERASCFAGPRVDNFQALDPRKQELLEARFLGMRSASNPAGAGSSSGGGLVQPTPPVQHQQTSPSSAAQFPSAAAYPAAPLNNHGELIRRPVDAGALSGARAQAGCGAAPTSCATAPSDRHGHAFLALLGLFCRRVNSVRKKHILRPVLRAARPDGRRTRDNAKQMLFSIERLASVGGCLFYFTFLCHGQTRD